MIRRSISGALDTIFALSSGSTASLPAAIAVIRISGDATPDILRAMIPPRSELPPPRKVECSLDMLVAFQLTRACRVVRRLA